jgi:lipopolysaccharide/colanic/teichoic acid biosynthesis glycosyltransferase
MGPKLIDIVSLFKNHNNVNILNGIHTADAFRAILERERSRAERTGQVFSLVVFGFEKEHNTDTAAQLERLGHVLGRKVRICDEVGWYDGNRIGTVLPGTSAEGARQFAEIIKERIQGTPLPLTCAIYTYPASWLESDDHPNSKGGRASSPDGKSIEPLDDLFVRSIPVGKRLIDLFVSIPMIILLSPLFLFVAIFIKIVSPGPVFFRQERIGYRGRPFTLWKFRTMHVNNNTEIHMQHIKKAIDSDSPITKLDDLNDNRIIPFGKLLRVSCLDELPQLFNVLMGDMSLIGPRPCLAFEAEKLLQWQKRRFDSLPGMSGLWQVSGKNHTTFKDMTRFDVRYSRKLSLALDARILLVTVPAILGMVFESHAKKKAIHREHAKLAALQRDPHPRG